MKEAFIGVAAMVSVSCAEMPPADFIVQLPPTTTPTIEAPMVPPIGNFDFSQCRPQSSINRVGPSGFPQVLLSSKGGENNCGVQAGIDFLVKEQGFSQVPCYQIRDSLQEMSPSLAKETRNDPGVRCRNAALCFKNSVDDMQLILRARYLLNASAVEDPLVYVDASMPGDSRPSTEVLFPDGHKCFVPQKVIDLVIQVEKEAEK
ncbi:MAG: hypothetical protein WCW30_03745 [Candidatus Gracilibacteria bacterium]|jgi:hypothetical protein